MATKTLYLDFVFDAPIERVFKALTDQHAIAKWLPPYGYTADIKFLQPRTGGQYEVVFTEFKTGNWFIVRGDYLAVVPNHVICYTEQFINSKGEIMGEIDEQTIMFSSDYSGTQIKIHQTKLKDRPLHDDQYLNWQESFSLLELLVND